MQQTATTTCPILGHIHTRFLRVPVPADEASRPRQLSQYPRRPGYGAYSGKAFPPLT